MGLRASRPGSVLSSAAAARRSPESATLRALFRAPVFLRLPNFPPRTPHLVCSSISQREWEWRLSRGSPLAVQVKKTTQRLRLPPFFTRITSDFFS